MKFALLFVLPASILLCINAQTTQLDPTTTQSTPTAAASEAVIPENIVIGGLFEPGFDGLTDEFLHALEVENGKRTLKANRAKGKVEQLEYDDSFQTTHAICELVKSGVVAIYGPQSCESARAAQSAASYLGVPHLEARMDFHPDSNHSVNLMPYPRIVAEAFRDLVSKKQWNKHAIVYDNKEGWYLVEELLRERTLRESNVEIRKMENDNEGDILRHLKEKDVRNIILILNTDGALHKFMTAAKEGGMLTPYNNYVVTSLCQCGLDRLLEKFPEPIEATLNSFSLVQDPESKYGTGKALAHDAVSHFAAALASLMESKPLERHNLTCDSETPWPYGLELRKKLVETISQGETGEIRFDSNGLRSVFKLRLLQNGNSKKMQTIGSWTTAEGIRLNDDHQDITNGKALADLKGKELKIVTINTAPFLEYSKDLLKLLKEELGFTGELQISGTGIYGRKNPENGSWNGMIGDLVAGRADLAIADLTVTEPRDQAVDFTTPFMETGVAIMIKKSDAENISSIQDLANQDEVHVGAISGGATEHFLQTVNSEPLNKIYSKMTDQCHNHTGPLRLKTGFEGIERVKAGGFAFMTEITAIEYTVNRNCDLKVLGEPLDKKNFAVALRKDSPYTNVFSKAIQKLKENGKLQELKNKYWIPADVNCDTTTPSG